MSRLQVTIDPTWKLEETMEVVMDAYGQRRKLQEELAMKELEEQESKLRHEGGDDEDERQLELKKRRLRKKKKTKAERLFEKYMEGGGKTSSKDEKFREWLQEIDLMENDKNVLAEMRKKRRGEAIFDSVVRKEGRFSTFISEGEQYFASNEHQKASQAYTKALNIRRHDLEAIRVSNVENEEKRVKAIDHIKETLIARSTCYAATGKFDLALADVDEALRFDPTYLKGILQQADALYAKGDFEFALVCYYKGYAMRKDVKAFLRGIRKAKISINEAIEQEELNKDIRLNSTMPDNKETVLPVMASSFDIQSLNDYMAADPNSAQEHMSMHHSFREKTPSAPLSRRSRRASNVHSLDSRVSQKENMSATGKKSLGELHDDELFLTNLRNDSVMSRFAGKRDGTYHDMIDNCLDYLESRKVFWSSQSSIQENPKSWISRTKPQSMTATAHSLPSSFTNVKELRRSATLSTSSNQTSLTVSSGKYRAKHVSHLYSESAFRRNPRQSGGRRPNTRDDMERCVKDTLKSLAGHRTKFPMKEKSKKKKKKRRTADKWKTLPTIEDVQTEIEYENEREEQDRLGREYLALIASEEQEHEKKQFLIKIKLDRERSRAPFEIRLQDHEIIKVIKQMMNDGSISEALSMAKRFLDKSSNSSVTDDADGEDSSRKEASVHDPRKRARVLCQLYGLMGSMYLARNMTSLASSHHERQIEIAEKHDFKDMKLDALKNMAKVHEANGSFREALEHYGKRIKSTPSPSEVVSLYSDMGLCHMKLGEYEKALPLLRAAIDVAAMRNEYIAQAELLYHIGSIHCERYEFEEAIETWERQAEFAEMCQDKSAMAKGYTSIGNVYLAMAERSQLQLDGGDENSEKENVEMSLHYQRLAMQILGTNEDNTHN